MSKPLYRVGNWSEYNRSLKQRGSLTLWLSGRVVEQWSHQGLPQRGAQFQYSDLAIETMLTIKKVCGLPLRQTEGLMGSIAKLTGLELQIPDYSTLSRRQKSLSVSLPRTRRGESLHLVVDSTGLKVHGDGEWKARQHGVSKRRTWRKLHLAVDEATGMIEADALTSNSADDAGEVGALLEETDSPLDTFGGDAAYDKRKVYALLRKRALKQGRAIQVNIPPRRDAKPSGNPAPDNPLLLRDRNLQRIGQVGRKQWKVESHYHRRSLAETAMFRFKTILGPNLAARTIERQKTEAAIGCLILNTFTQLGMPQSYKVA